MTRPSEEFHFNILQQGEGTKFLTLRFSTGTCLSVAWQHALLLTTRGRSMQLRFATAEVRIEFADDPSAPSAPEQVIEAIHAARLDWIREVPGKITITVERMDLPAFPVPFVP